MASHSADSRPVAQEFPWPANSSTCSRSYTVAAVRAGVIALVLLGILALIVLY